MEINAFGGEWTLKKLEVLQKYLSAYLNIFHGNSKAQHLKPYFVDGFAGCGSRSSRAGESEILSLFDSTEDKEEAEQLAMSSPRIALGLEKAFAGYLFVERNQASLNQLESLVRNEFLDRYPECNFECVDANEFLPAWCSGLGHKDRAVMFLDPFGTEVRWDTIEAIAKTKKIDLWLLFPCSGVLRMLPRDSRPTDAWVARLNSLFGTDSWLKNFYKTGGQSDLFGGPETEYRDLNALKLARWVTSQLGTIFHQTVPDPLILYNRRNSPLFMLCFAAGNPRGAPTACKIARYIIEAQLKVR